MLQTRPQYSAFLLERPRLLRALPEEAGYVVWLEAPYGYGKSVLLSQWAAALEAEGVSIVWLSLSGSDARTGLALALDLPDATPWPLILAALHERQAAVVLEDLEGPEGLGPLLHHLPGLVALASRTDLPEPELLRLKAQGRLVHLGPPELAFTPDEAETLFQNRTLAQAAWERSGGWPLPLHLASLMGGTPFGPALWTGLKESLTPEEWAELLLLSALPFLPGSAADQRAPRLARLGFVQPLEGGYRLHPLAAEELARAFPAERLAAIRAGLERLPPPLRADACAKAELWPELTGVLEAEYLAEQDSPGVLRWHAQLSAHEGQAKFPVGPPVGPGRLLNLAWAYSALGQWREGHEACLRVARHPQASAKQRRKALSWAISDLPGHEVALAEELVAEAQPWLAQSDEAGQAAFWGNVAIQHMTGGRWRQAQTMLERAVSLRPESPTSPNRINLAQVRWEAHGELRFYLDQLQAALNYPGALPFNRAVNLGALGLLGSLLDPQAALIHLAEQQTLSRHHPLEALWGRATAAWLRRDLNAFPDLHAEARAWAEQDTRLGRESLGWVAARWGRALREAGHLQEARTRLAGALDCGEALVAVELALTLHALGQHEEAQPLLVEGLNSPYRYTRLHAWAARYRMGRDPAALEEVLNLTTERQAVLPALIPVTQLPPDRPELALAYSLHDVLASGWKAAIARRQAEIPPLELRVLGSVQVKVLGQEVALNGRPRDLLVLSALGLTREAMAEALWPEVDAQKSRNNLHVNLSTLRRTLEPWGQPGYLTEVGLRNTRCDLWNLQEAIRRGDWAQVRRLYQPLAPELTLDAITGQRAALQEDVLQGCLDHLTAPEAEDTLNWVLRLDPLHEQAMQQLLSLLLRSGRRVSAEKRYQAYRSQLRRELGVPPDPALQRLFG